MLTTIFVAIMVFLFVWMILLKIVGRILRMIPWWGIVLTAIGLAVYLN